MGSLLDHDQIDPLLMDIAPLVPQPPAPSMALQQLEDGDPAHFGPILAAIHIGSNDVPPNGSLSAHEEQWQRQSQSKKAQKRKRTQSDSGESGSLTKLRRIIQEQVLPLDASTRNRHMTTITTYHASAAQKSYGQEKRFLCPPPMVRVSGPLVPHLRNQVIKMAVISEGGDILNELVTAFDPENGIVCFKQLHITSQGKDKQFQLSLSLAEHTGASPSDPNGVANALNETLPATQKGAATNPISIAAKSPWAILNSPPIHIISKPSKKTTRGNTPGISNLGSIALFNRINSQTVRTKYLSHRRDGLTTSSAHWAPFTLKLVSDDAPGSAILYGSRVVLCVPHGPDGTGGFQSHEFIIRKVEKQRALSSDYGRPVSQMQKIALLRADIAPTDGQVYYLSALVEPRPGEESITVVPGSTHSTSWRRCDVKQEQGEDGAIVEWHEVNDYSTWMIASIDKFQCTFFDATGANASPPRGRITPAPVVQNPVRWGISDFKNGNHHLEVSVSSFFTSLPNGEQECLQVWVGNLGPLRILRQDGHPPPSSGASNGPSTNQDYVVIVTTLPTGLRSLAASPSIREPPTQAHLVIELPSMANLRRALLDIVKPRSEAGSSSRSANGHHVGTSVAPQDEEMLLENGFEDMPEEQDEEQLLSTRDASLPLLFVRGSERVGFHSGYVLRCVRAAAAAGESASGQQLLGGWSVWASRVENLG